MNQATPQKPEKNSVLSPSTMAMIDYMDLTVADIEKMFGTDYDIYWGDYGGYEMAYSEESGCPFWFLYHSIGDEFDDDRPRP